LLWGYSLPLHAEAAQEALPSIYLLMIDRAFDRDSLDMSLLKFNTCSSSGEVRVGLIFKKTNKASVWR